MRCRLCIWIIPLVAALNGAAARADGLLKRSPRPNPSEHVPALIKTLTSDLDDRKRADAAAELRDYDIKTFPDIIPALVEALKNDASMPVRLETANSIGKLRPISQVGGYALEQAEQNDSAIAVRVLARNHLRIWVLFHGYKRGRMPDPLANQSEEPPLADSPPAPAPKMEPAKKPPMMPNSFGAKANPPRVAPPLVPAIPASMPKNERFIPQLMKRIKPDLKSKTGEDGPSINVPR